VNSELSYAGQTRPTLKISIMFFSLRFLILSQLVPDSDDHMYENITLNGSFNLPVNNNMKRQ
jgi:hypothetical protein